MNEAIKRIEALLPIMKKEDDWGTYYMGKFYFTIATNKKRYEVGLTDNKRELSLEVQRKLQLENYPALFHEYIHYLHELSTVIGNAGLALELSGKSIFTHWLDNDPKTAFSKGYTNNLLGAKYAKVITTQGVLIGNADEVINGKFIEVKKIDYVEQEVHFPNDTDFVEGKLLIPKIQFTELVDTHILKGELLFGKYFLYEGLAYELDRIVDMQVRMASKINDEAKATEYTVLRRVAQYIFPQIEKRTFLSIGSMTLQYIDCGRTFIEMVRRVKKTT